MLDTKERILEEAAELFKIKGYEAVRTKEIALKAEVSEATVFKYYKSKKNLYNEVFRLKYNMPSKEECIKWLKTLECDSFQDYILNIARASSKYFYKNKDILAMMHKEQEGFLPGREALRAKKGVDMHAEAYQEILKQFKYFYEQGVLNENYEKYLNIFMKILSGLYVRVYYDKSSEEELFESIEMMVDIYLNGVLNLK